MSNISWCDILGILGYRTMRYLMVVRYRKIPLSRLNPKCDFQFGWEKRKFSDILHDWMSHCLISYIPRISHLKMCFSIQVEVKIGLGRPGTARPNTEKMILRLCAAILSRAGWAKVPEPRHDMARPIYIKILISLYK